MSLPTLQGVFSDDQIDVLKAWIATKVIDQAVALVDTSNTATGTTSCTVNGRTGVAVFTHTLTSGEATTYTITNSAVTADTILLLSLEYQYSGSLSGSPVILWYRTTANTVTIGIKNVHASQATNANLAISFQFINL